MPSKHPKLPNWKVPDRATVPLSRCPGPHTQCRWMCDDCIAPRAMRDRDYPIYEENFAPYKSPRDGKYLPICEMCFHLIKGTSVDEDNKTLVTNWKCVCEQRFETKVMKSRFCHDCSIQYYDDTAKEVIREGVRNYDLMSRKLETEDAVVCGKCYVECIPREELVSLSPQWYMCAGCQTPRAQVVEDLVDNGPPDIPDPPPSLEEEPGQVCNTKGCSCCRHVKRIRYPNKAFHISRPTDGFIDIDEFYIEETGGSRTVEVDPSPLAAERTVGSSESDGHPVEVQITRYSIELDRQSIEVEVVSGGLS